MSYEITSDCSSCGKCAEECALAAIEQGEVAYAIDQEFCTECGACQYVCDSEAIVCKPIPHN
jgi:MinD superfamily P-loop ATPase